MSSLNSIINMYSGMNAAQRGLQVTGNNLSNINTTGYTRQQLLQHDAGYKTVQNGQQVGYGVSITEVRQIRNELADIRIREENSFLSYYSSQSNAISEIEAILDEPNGESVSKVLNSFWNQTQKLATNPSGVEERLSFIQTASVLAKKLNYVMDAFTSYQEDVNTQVGTKIDTINTLTEQIKDLNYLIMKSEVNGDNANDYRDMRNKALDELSTHLDIKYYTDEQGMVVVSSEGRNLVNKSIVTKMETALTFTDDMPNSGFVKPVWSDTKTDVFDLSRQVGPQFGNDTSGLKGLLMVRGDGPADSNTSWDTIALNDKFSADLEGNSFLIPQLQKKLSMFATTLTETINNILQQGQGQGVYAGQPGVPVFVPIKGTELTAGNIKVNPELLENGGYNRLGTSKTGDLSDTSLVEEVVEAWKKPQQWFADGETSSPNKKLVNFMDFYAEFVTEIGTQGYLYSEKASEKRVQVSNLENNRMAMGSVSQDEELSAMLKYQHAYSAAARMVTVMDGMLDKIINNM